MAVAVDFAELARRVAEYGPVALVVTAGGGGPHVVSAAVATEDEALVADVGATTAANAERTGVATLVWPAPAGATHVLIVDGAASVRAGDQQLVVAPVRAVLHRLANAPADLPSCITVLDRRR